MFDTFSLPLLGFLIGAPILAIAVLNVFNRKRGGVSAAWAGVLFISLAWVLALMFIVERAAG